MKFSDKVLNKISGRNIETIPMTLEQMVALLNKLYISQASTQTEYDEIIKTLKGSLWRDKTLLSKDGKFEINCSTGNAGGIFNWNHKNDIWIHEKETDKFYEYHAHSFKKLRKMVQERISARKANL